MIQSFAGPREVLTFWYIHKYSQHCDATKFEICTDLIRPASLLELSNIDWINIWGEGTRERQQPCFQGLEGVERG